MLAASAARILDRLPEDALVLDVGGWGKPFARADWVVDLMPYATRGAYGDSDPAAERFSDRTWVCRDICDPEPWPFENGQFAFAICSHTLEDVRDPLRVCAELNRVARAGYVEVPSRLEEQAWGVGGDWVGWSHHRWLVDVAANRIEFVHKPHVLHARPRYQVPAALAATLRAEERVQTLFWEGGFDYRERIFFVEDEFEEYLAGFVRDHRPALEARLPARSRRARLRAALTGR